MDRHNQKILIKCCRRKKFINIKCINFYLNFFIIKLIYIIFFEKVKVKKNIDVIIDMYDKE